MARDSNTFLVPRTSLRSPGFFGPVALTTMIVIASLFTAPVADDFSVVKIGDATFVGTIGIWGICSRFRTDNATNVNPNATLTGNATFDALVHSRGIHRGCSSPRIGFSFSLATNATGLTVMPPPDSDTLGIDVQPGSATKDGGTWNLVMTKTQSVMPVVHLAAAAVLSLGLLLLLVPHKKFEKSAPHLARFFKSCSLSLLLIMIGTLLAAVSFVLSLRTGVQVRDNINAIANVDGVQASLGNLMWFPLVAAVINVAAIWSTRGRMGDE